MSKPHIYRHTSPYSGIVLFFCSDGRWLGWGESARGAYVNWSSRASRSCVHNRPTALQRRRTATRIA